MKNILFITFSFIVSFCFSQIPPSNYSIDLTNFEYKILENKNYSKMNIFWKGNKIDIFPGYGFIGKIDSILEMDHFHTVEDSKRFGWCLINKKDSIPMISHSGLTFKYHKNSYQITKLKTEKEEQYIYLYTGSDLEAIASNSTSIFELLGGFPPDHIIFKDLEFKPGTYN